ncbi:MAG: aspartate-semialdehyde dehydrogenase [Bacteroidales bacterium]|nr:aspartate-semialdehyde dehydrogenase [Bacteroidales bacterium]MDY6347929.1 aspartate-semialdehyde dehydrogenase [Bacteroidales bacterium]
MKIALVGATGLVGGVMLKVLEERGFCDCDLIPAASSRSVGKTIKFGGREIRLVSVEDAISAKPEFAIFSAGSAASLEYAPKFAANGTTVIDNSSAWRSLDNIPLVVPEINGDVITADDRIIANPNCSTIQMVMALAPLHKKYRVKRLVISTYQSVTGTGVKAVNQLMKERAGEECEMAYPHPIDLNLIPHGGSFCDDGYTTEEVKLVNETRKILRDGGIQITATVVRVPVTGGHSEAVNVEFHEEFDIDEVRGLLRSMPGVTVLDNPAENAYPMPRFAENKDDVFVGRIRRDLSQPRTLNLWVVADNLRKGAATNAVQILQYIVGKK